jgi:hypothetical protein
MLRKASARGQRVAVCPRCAAGTSLASRQLWQHLRGGGSPALLCRGVADLLGMPLPQLREAALALEGTGVATIALDRPSGQALVYLARGEG